MKNVTKADFDFKPCMKKRVVVQAVQMPEDFLVDTLEGPLKGNAGDYLIIGVKGERYPIRQDIFKETYDWVEETKSNDVYEVRYEKGISNIINVGCNSLQDAIEISRESILGCMPQGFDPNNLVRPIIARKIGVCAVCGIKPISYRTKTNLESLAGLCSDCVDGIEPLKEGL